MCKIMTITGIKAKQGGLLKFARATHRQLSKTESDGFGYAATDGKNLFSEAWMHSTDAFKHRNYVDDKDSQLIELFRGAIDKDPTYLSNGTVDRSLNSVTTITMHARTQTNTHSLENTHPFVIDGVSLIHNGIIHNHDKWRKKLSTCDSESILTKYLKDDVRHSPMAIEGIFSQLQGYYACAVLLPTVNGYALDVFKCNNANLSFAVVKELGNAFIWTTTERDLKEICKALNWSEPRFFDFDAFTLVRCDAVTGKPIMVHVCPVDESRFNIGTGSKYSDWREVDDDYDDRYDDYDRIDESDVAAMIASDLKIHRK